MPIQRTCIIKNTHTLEPAFILQAFRKCKKKKNTTYTYTNKSICKEITLFVINGPVKLVSLYIISKVKMLSLFMPGVFPPTRHSPLSQLNKQRQPSAPDHLLITAAWWEGSSPAGGGGYCVEVCVFLRW